jgi:hypothetical protein
MVISDNPLTEISATKGIDEVWINGIAVDRQELTRKFEIKVRGITDADRRNELELQRQEAIAAVEAKMTHYGNGKFVLAAKSLPVATGLTVPTPRHSNASASSGPPYRVTVTFPGAAGADLQAFYRETLQITKWTASGNCWEKGVPGQESKKFRACPEASAGRIVLTIAVQ